tara:strand:- start:60 stop:317 length:258 start_codon:yes stop_codon:yes gene_type:complete
MIKDMHYQKRKDINNILFTISTFLIALGIQGLLPLPPMFAWFFVFTGNLVIYWVAWNEGKRKLMFLTVVMFFAQGTNLLNQWGAI